jgi:glycosyltransferase involved in cell wall biosynthesis
MHYTPEWKGRLEAYAASDDGAGCRIRLGYVPSSWIEAYFRAADVVVLPYLWSSQSGVLNLARGFRRPVVVTDVLREAPEIDGVSGRSVPAGDARALAAAVAGLLALSDAERRVLGTRGLRLAQELRGWERAAAALREAWIGRRDTGGRQSAVA